MIRMLVEAGIDIRVVLISIISIIALLLFLIMDRLVLKYKVKKKKTEYKNLRKLRKIEVKLVDSRNR